MTINTKFLINFIIIFISFLEVFLLMPGTISNRLYSCLLLLILPPFGYVLGLLFGMPLKLVQKKQNQITTKETLDTNSILSKFFLFISILFLVLIPFLNVEKTILLSQFPHCLPHPSITTLFMSIAFARIKGK
jgi:hypothetical protein